MSLNFEELRTTETMIIKMWLPEFDFNLLTKKFTFFYDETGNFRRILIKEEGGFNIKNINSIFVLGGIVLDNSLAENELSKDEELLRRMLKIQPTAPEIKLKYIAKGEFLELLESSNLETFLKWLSDKPIYIHFSLLNILYWSLVDIIDSFIDFNMWGSQFSYIEDYLRLKDELYQAVLNNLGRVQLILVRYKYPNVSDVQLFIHELIKAINIEDYPRLKAFFKLFGNKSEAPFITDEKPYVLLDSFLIFYLRNSILFKNSEHYFDYEKTIIKDLQKGDLSKLMQYVYKIEFLHSTSSFPLQISDVIVGIIGKMYNFLANADKTELQNIRLSCQQINNLKIFTNLLSKSVEFCSVFSHSIAPISLKEKEDILWNKI